MSVEDLRGLQSVRLKKATLLEVMTGNRDEHRAIFEEALEGWQKDVVAALEQSVKDAKAGKEYRLHIALVRPEDHTADYNSVITMLEMSLDEELELNYAEFRQYVMDEWGWQRQFLTTSSNYSDTASNRLNNLG